MAEATTVKVYCPRCGKEAEVAVQVSAIERKTNHIGRPRPVLEVSFDSMLAVHACAIRTV